MIVPIYSSLRAFSAKQSPIQFLLEIALYLAMMQILKSYVFLYYSNLYND